MARCNAWYGEPQFDSVHYVCQLPKGHEGWHEYQGHTAYGEIKIQWNEDSRREYLLRQRGYDRKHRKLRRRLNHGKS